MKKLIELLNEYEKDWLNEFETYVERWYCERTEQILSGKWENNNELKPCEIISKKYWFIKWLVDNNKIDLKEFHRLCWIINQDSEYWNWTPQDYEQVIMYLSISDYPIEDLISILK